MNYSEILGASKYHRAIAIASTPRKSDHSYTGHCVDVFFAEPSDLVRFQKMVGYKLGIFLAVSYEQDYARVRVPVEA